MKQDIQAIKKDIALLQSLLKRFETEITDEEMQTVNRICEHAKVPSPAKIDINTICQLVLRVFDIFKDYF